MERLENISGLKAGDIVYFMNFEENRIYDGTSYINLKSSTVHLKIGDQCKISEIYKGSKVFEKYFFRISSSNTWMHCSGFSSIGTSLSNEEIQNSISQLQEALDNES